LIARPYGAFIQRRSLALMTLTALVVGEMRQGKT